ncbi:hypothetical protein HDV06_002818 [Boothiomyces sp. JEL0866]|nr:hypothetical protein HDV06_002818 [Boothiomyces sp. JEL0866]
MSFDPTDPTLGGKIYGDINQGWVVVKLIELAIIPYGYFCLRPNKIAFVLFVTTLINIPHNVTAYVANYLTDIDLIDAQTLSILYNPIPWWIANSICVAAIRSMEMYCNYLIITAVADQGHFMRIRIATALCMLLVGVVNVVGILAEPVNSIYFTAWWDMVASTFDNCRALIVFIDLLMTRLETSKSKTTKNNGGTLLVKSDLKSISL